MVLNTVSGLRSVREAAAENGLLGGLSWPSTWPHRKSDKEFSIESLPACRLVSMGVRVAGGGGTSVLLFPGLQAQPPVPAHTLSLALHRPRRAQGWIRFNGPLFSLQAQSRPGLPGTSSWGRSCPLFLATTLGQVQLGQLPGHPQGRVQTHTRKIFRGKFEAG